eukprot:6392118-Lingulodinium_polyedra.AAC.1
MLRNCCERAFATNCASCAVARATRFASIPTRLTTDSRPCCVTAHTVQFHAAAHRARGLRCHTSARRRVADETGVAQWLRARAEMCDS